MTDRINVFLDTDIGPDCDDASALAVLLDLCKKGYANIIGITHCTGSSYGLATIDAITRLFNTDVPVGTCANKSFLCDGASLSYTPSVQKRFFNRYAPDSYQPDASDALIAALSNVPDKSVTFIEIGPQINLGRFLREEKTARLMKQKVNRIVMMAGCFEFQPQFAEWNIEMAPNDARTVTENWDGLLDYCPFEVFRDVLTGQTMSRYPETPVSLAYRLNTKGSMMRPSWDPGTIITTILGTQGMFEWSEFGVVHIDDTGKTIFTPYFDGKHRYLRRKGSISEVAAMIEAHIESATQTMTGVTVPMYTAPAPLFNDPIFEGAADPTIIWNHLENTWWIVYTQRRANAPACGVGWAHGSALGVASSDDNGQTWIYRGTLDLEPAEKGHNTYWAPEILFAEDKYHMFVSFVRGIPETWERPRHILHYTSDNLWNWKFEATLEVLGNKAIDACVIPLPEGGWRLFYKNEAIESHTQYADSADLYHWIYKGDATNDCAQEGPNAFELGGEYFMIADVWDGLAVYKSDDWTHWKRKENILSGHGSRLGDCNRAHHADVLSFGNYAYLFYFVNPTEQRDAYEVNAPSDVRKSVLQVAKLVNENGAICVIRDEPFEFILPNI